MITDEDDEVLEFNLDLNSEYNFQELSSKDQHMSYCLEEEGDEVNQEYHTTEQHSVYQELAEKDNYLMLAAEAGKVLLEKNQELNDNYQRLQEEYLQKVEALEQERHHLKRELQTRDYTYESRMQDLQHELGHLSGQLQTVQKASRTTELSNKSNLDDLNVQNSSLIQELDQVKNYNQDLAQQVQTLSKRIDGRINNNGNSMKRTSGIFPDYDAQDGGINNDAESMIDYEEMKNLKLKVQRLSEDKLYLEDSLNGVAHEKDVIITDHRTTVGKMSILETEVLSLKQQIGICQEDLNKTKKKNVKLKDQLEEYVVSQSQNMGRSDGNNSLFSELEMSLSEADMNFQNMSTPNKRRSSEEYEELPDIFITSPKKADMDKLALELRTVYQKIKTLKSKLTEEENDREEDNTEDSITTEMISKLVDQVIHLIQDKILSLGVIDPRMESPRIGSENGDDTESLPDSRLSDSEVELLEQQVYDLNQRLNIKTSECENAKKELQATQASAMTSQEKADTLTITNNKQEREIEGLRKEREIMLADTTIEEKLKQVLQERDEALQRANELTAGREQTNSDMQKLNSQLIAAVQQKLELSEQLEAWQFDMASLIDQQLSSQIKRDQKKSRKRSSNQPSKSNLLSKLFAGRNNNSRDTSQTGTPRGKSPVTPK